MMRKKSFILSLIFAACSIFTAKSAVVQLNRTADDEINVIDLSGKWKFDKDPSNVGLTNTWYKSKTFDDTINLPSTIDEQHKGTAESKQTGRFTRIYAYTGVAWYQKTFNIPDSMVGKRIVFEMERSKVTRVWYDGILVGTSDSYITTQQFLLTNSATSGSHTITVRVNNNNDEKPPVSGTHQISDGTQTNWNGILGKIRIHAMNNVWIKNIQIYPDIDKKTAKIQVKFGNITSAAFTGNITFNLQTWNIESPKLYDPIILPVNIATGDSIFEYTYSIGSDMQLWSEFQPALYRLKAEMNINVGSQKLYDKYETDFGMHKLSIIGSNFAINGKKILMRGKHDAAVFPMTGYPPMDVDSWKNILSTYKSYGINHIRCHTWCPPRAALEAADIIGMYWLPELPHWGAVGTKVDTVIGDVEQKTEVYDNTTQYLIREGNNYLDEMGNLPSFAMFELGNELSGDRTEMIKIINGFKTRDPRHLYADGANCFLWAPALSSSDDYWTTTMTGGTYGSGTYYNTDGLEVRSSYPNHNVGHVNNILCGTDYDYTTAIKNIQVPVISHETGQYQVYPDYHEISKFTGVTRAYNFETFKQRLINAGLGEYADKYFKASGQLAALCYREDIESSIRTKGFGGFQLLDLQDYPGQGTALVGKLDDFLDSKGIIEPKKWREFCNDVVPLLRHTSFTWTTAQTFITKAEIANYSASDITTSAQWTLKDSTGTVINQGTLSTQTINQGGITELGNINIDLSKVAAPQKLEITLSLPNSDYQNSYPIWVYPAAVDNTISDDIKVFTTFSSEAQKVLKNGGKVLLLPTKSAMPTSIDGAFQTDFWNYDMFKGYNPPGTLGILCDPSHPVLSDFPTEYHSNWQWWRLLKHGRPINLATLPTTLSPIIRVIDNFSTNRNLGIMFEAKVGNGKLMVCSMNLQNEQSNPEGRQMLHSILNYMESDKFDPTTEMTSSQVQTVVLADTVEKKAVSLSYDFQNENSSTSATTPIASDITNGKNSGVTAGVCSYKENNAYTSNGLKIYSCTNTRNGSGVINLNRFGDASTNYSVTWKQILSSTENNYKIGVLMRGDTASVGTSSAGYTQGIMAGYLFSVFNNESGNNSEFRIYKSTKETNLSMLANSSVSTVNPSAMQPMWYRATVTGTSPVTLTFEYSSDSTTWTTASTYSDANSSFAIGATQFVWGLGAASSNFYIDDILFNGVTYSKEIKLPMTVTRINCIEDMSTSNNNYGKAYQLSNSTVKFDHSNNLLCSLTTDNNGHIILNDTYSKLVFHVNNLTSTGGYASSNTTLYYINNKGSVSSHNYGTVNFNKSGNFDIVFDISKTTLTDGCSGIICINNSNWSSALSISFGDVYLLKNDEIAFKVLGTYVPSDSTLNAKLNNENLNYIDFTDTYGLTGKEDWHSLAANKNSIFFVSNDNDNSNTNVICGNICKNLELTTSAGNFYTPSTFTTESAIATIYVNGYSTIILPFTATIPANVSAYSAVATADNSVCTKTNVSSLTKNTPALISSSLGNISFAGSGSVNISNTLTSNALTGVYAKTTAPSNSYILKSDTYIKTSTSDVINPFCAYLTSTSSSDVLTLKFDEQTNVNSIYSDNNPTKIYDLSGYRVKQLTHKGIYIIGNKKVIK